MFGFQRGSPNDCASNDLRDLEADVDPDQVHQLERPHPEAAAEAADAVDLLVRRDALLEQPQRLARRTGGRSGSRGSPGPSLATITRLPIASPTARASVERALARLRGGDHLEQLHQRRRVEEVHADDVLRAAPRRSPASSRGSTTCSCRGRSRAARPPTAARTARASARPARAPPRSRARSRASSSSEPASTSRASASAASSSLQRPRSAPVREPAVHALAAALERLRERVVQVGVDPGEAAELGDARRPSCRRPPPRALAGSSVTAP